MRILHYFTLSFFLFSLANICDAKAQNNVSFNTTPEKIAINESREAIDKTWLLDRQNQSSECLLEKKANGKNTLIYKGWIKSELVKCIIVNQDNNVETFRITSNGGEVEHGVVSGILINNLGWKIEVLGMCFSSCANYVFPAAKSATILPFSVVGFHGSPKFSDDKIRKYFKDTIEKAGHKDKAFIDASVENSVKANDIGVEMNNAFVNKFKIGNYWSNQHPKLIELFGELYLGRGFWLANKQIYQSCLSKKLTSNSWEVKNEEDFKILQELHASENIVLFQWPQNEDFKCN